MTHTRMTDTQWFHIRPFLYICSVLRVGKDAHGRLGVEALRRMTRMGAPGCALPPAYGKSTSRPLRPRVTGGSGLGTA